MNTHEEGKSTTKLDAAVSASLAASKFIVLAVFVASIAAIAVHFMRDKQTYFVTSVSGDAKEVFPLTEPNVTPTSLINWVTLAVTSSYTLDFYGYEQSLNELKQYFTLDGYQNFITSLNESGSLKKIIKDKLVVTAVPINTAIVLQEGIMDNVYTWKIQIPLLVNYQGASTTSTKKTIAVSVLVIRVPTNQAPKGIGIAQIVDGTYNAAY